MRDNMDNEIKPVSEIAGNIEVTFNSKNKEIDYFEPILEQLVLTIGKTGRANRLTFENLDSESVYEVVETLEDIADQLAEIEEDAKIDEEEFDISNIERIEPTPAKDGVKEFLDKEESMKIDELGNKVIDEKDVSKEEFEKAIEELKRDGELFNPEPGKVQRI